jgi:4-hydroxy-tetrahydrodipicolinate reductase
MGAKGRMGARVCALAEAAHDFEIAGRYDIDALPEIGSGARATCDLVIDFSSESGAQRAAELSNADGAALLICTTGLSSASLRMIESCGKNLPVMIAANTSRGMAVMAHAVTEISRLLKDMMDVDIIEAHHAQKKDRPSGTAKRLARAVEAGSGHEFPDERVLVIRAGGIIGRHTVQFADQGEILELTHNVMSRDVFAAGALDAGRWLVKQKPGVHYIEQAWNLPAATAPRFDSR